MLHYNPQILGRFVSQLDAGVLAFNAFYEVKSGVITGIATTDETILPNTIYIETGSHCNGRCRDCYVPIDDRKQEITLTVPNLGEILDTAYKIGVNYLTILGGEPFDSSVVDINMKMFHDNPWMRFTLCTSATDMDEKLIDELGRYRNVSPVFSFDGPERFNDHIRGRGSYSKLKTTLKTYSQGGRRLAGAIVTLRPENIEAATSREFVDDLCKMGCYFIEFGPYYTEGQAHKLTSETYAAAVMRLIGMSTEVPSIIFSNHFGQLFGDIIDLKKRLQSVTVDYRGNVYSARRGRSFGNINTQSLMEILFSEDFQQLFRAKHREFDTKFVAETDARYEHLFGQTVSLLEEHGVKIKGKS